MLKETKQTIRQNIKDQRPMLIIYSNDTGSQEWAVQIAEPRDESEEDFWMSAFPTFRKAVDYCGKHRLPYTIHKLNRKVHVDGGCVWFGDVIIKRTKNEARAEAWCKRIGLPTIIEERDYANSIAERIDAVFRSINKDWRYFWWSLYGSEFREYVQKLADAFFYRGSASYPFFVCVESDMIRAIGDAVTEYLLEHMGLASAANILPMRVFLMSGRPPVISLDCQL